MSVSLRKTQVAASNAEGLDVLMTVQPAGSWAVQPNRGIPFRIDTVLPGRPGDATSPWNGCQRAPDSLSTNTTGPNPWTSLARTTC